MPVTRNYAKHPWAHCHIEIKRGQQANLAKCLGYSSHQSVYAAWGYKPRGKRADALLKLAGPYGEILAKIKLRDPNTKLGKDKNRFVHVIRTWCKYEQYHKHIYLQWQQREPIKTVVVNGHRYLRFGYHPET